MKVVVVGTGYVGLVTGACFSERGFDVTCVDNNKEKINGLKNGVIPIYEPELDKIVINNYKAGRLSFTTDLPSVLEKSDIVFLALPTPPGKDGSADLSYLIDVVKEIAKLISSYKVIVDKSTVPVGTADKVKEIIAQQVDENLFSVVSNPEFLREGFAIKDFMHPCRVVIGSSDKKAIELLTKLYKPFVNSDNQLLIMDEKSAELTKYAANTFLATKISFMNEISNFCEKVGANVDSVREGIGMDERIGKRFLFPGIGYGGSCFPKDVRALVNSGKLESSEFKVISAAMEVNKIQKGVIVNKLKNYFKNDLSKKNIALWGLAFKPNTDDIREASSLEIIDFLISQGVKLTVHDPQAMDNIKTIYADKINYCSSFYDAVEGVDALVIATEWEEYINSDLIEVKQKMSHPVIFDGRNIFSLNRMRKENIYYNSMGRELITAANEK